MGSSSSKESAGAKPSDKPAAARRTTSAASITVIPDDDHTQTDRSKSEDAALFRDLKKTFLKEVLEADWYVLYLCPCSTCAVQPAWLSHCPRSATHLDDGKNSMTLAAAPTPPTAVSARAWHAHTHTRTHARTHARTRTPLYCLSSCARSRERKDTIL